MSHCLSMGGKTSRLVTSGAIVYHAESKLEKLAESSRVPPEKDKPVPSRYSRQILFAGIGAEGQDRLLSAQAGIVGCGALGAMQASLLARAGLGRIRIIDRDFVEESNLQRQILFDEEDARQAMPKAVAAVAKLKAVNSQIHIEGIVEDVNPSTIERLLGGCDILLDATDNFDARFLINDYSVQKGIPWIYGGCVGSYGLTFPILPRDSACLRCIFEEAPPAGSSPTCDTAGIIGPIAGVIASFQVAEALKILAGRAERVHRRIRTIDLWTNRHDEVALPGPAPSCPCCGQNEFPFLEGRLGAETTSLCGRNSVQILRREETTIDLDALARRLEPLARVIRNPFLLRAFVDDYQLTVFPDGRALISGTRDPAVAKSLYARFLGA